MSETSTLFKEYEVVRKEVNSDTIKSFYLRPAIGACPSFTPGDYLVFEIPSVDGNEPIRREYSISFGDSDCLRVTIKREDAPAGTNVADGRGSTFFHNKVDQGDIVRAYGPTGKFSLNKKSEKPVVLLGAGVGQTPLLAMLHALGEQNSRETVFIHACKNGAFHAMANEVKDLVGRHEKLRSHLCFVSPCEIDELGRDYDSAGYITKQLLSELMPAEPPEFYLCGPGPFMEAMYSNLVSLGVSDDAIKYEYFGEATLLKSTKAKSTAFDPSVHSGPIVTFSKSDVKVPWDPEIGNLLELAEEYGVVADFSCRSGTCESCKAAIVNGEIDYVEEPFERPEEGFVLLCVACPKGDVTIDI